MATLTKKYEQAEQLVAESDYVGANQLLTTMKQEKLQEPFYASVMEKVTHLSDSVTKKLDAQQAEEAETKKKQAEADATKTKESTETQAATIVPALFIGYWGEKGASASVFELSGTHYIDSMTGQSYKLTSVDQSGGVLTLVWDVQEYEQRNGSGSAGPGPQPFMFMIHSDGTLGAMSGKEIYVKM